MSAALNAYRERHGEPDTIELVACDLSGGQRGKRVAPAEYDGVFTSGFNFPSAAFMLDLKGDTCDQLPYGGADGDPDVKGRVIADSLSPMPWCERPTAQALYSLHSADGQPHFADSRACLARINERLRARGLTVVMATELEFYLLDAACDEPTPRLPRIFGTSQRQDGIQVYQLDDLRQVDPFINALNDTCSAQGLPITTTLSEFGPGQLEVNLHHVDDPVLACDHAVLLKRAAKAVALEHGFVACFMAKPFAEHAGNGLHIHVSLVDESGTNFFAAGEGKNAPPFSKTLLHAVGGLTETMADAMAVFAPNANSFRRLRPDFYAPVMANWGSNHRQVSVRIPLSGPNNRRIEHRTAGADANPYLVAAAVLAGIDHGLGDACKPPAMVCEGEEVELVVELPIRWDQALDRFEKSTFIEDYFGSRLREAYTGVRRTEAQRFHNEISNVDFQWYLRQV